jgi:hypothetical protein
MSVLDQLNLRPQERRILVVVGFLIFVVLNWMFVRPLFGQWAAGQEELAKTRRTQERYQAEINKAPTYKALEDSLKKAGNEVLTEELQLQRIVIEQYANASGVSYSRSVPGTRPTSGRTNQFFEDQGLTVDFNTYSTNFVEWLVGLATGNNMIRVQEMNLKPDPSGHRLSGSILFIASYQKKTAPKTSTTPSGATTVARAPSAGTNTPSTNKAAQPFSAPKTTIKTNSAANRPATNTTKPPPKK